MKPKNDTLNSVAEFHQTFNQPILLGPKEPPVDRKMLRLSLILEELVELSEGMGVNEQFNKMLYDKADYMSIAVLGNKAYDQVEVLDALADLEYVLMGTVLETGNFGMVHMPEKPIGFDFGVIFDEAFQEVHESNMSKACSSLEEAEATVKSYSEKGVETHYEEKGGVWLIYRTADNKVLKSINYRPANLKQFIPNQNG